MALRFDQIELSGSSNGEKPVIQASGHHAQISTAYGYMNIGPGNSSYSHFYTDRAKYYFDKKIMVDQGIISSFDEDLHLKVNNDANTVMTLSKTSPYNVGIGTTSPQGQLHLYGGNLDTRELGSQSASNVIYLNTKNGPSAGGGTGIGPGLVWAPYYSGYTKRSAGIMQIAEGNYFRSALAFYTNNTSDASTDWSERMRIDMDGKVGIGTANPTQALDVVGQIQMWDSGAQARLNINNTGTGDSQVNFQLGGSSAFAIGVDNSDSDKFKISGSGGLLGSNDRLVIDSTGKVGIGTTDPQEKLDVNGNIYLSGLLPTSSIIWKNPTLGTGPSITTNSAASLIFNSSAIGETMRILNNNGNVGIGTTNPNQKLHVENGGIRVEKYATGLGGFVSVGNATETAGNYSAYLFGNTSSDTGYFKGGIAYETLSTTHGRGDMHFLQRSDTGSGNANISHSVMTILNGGNVGIGTTSPSEKLSVSGNSGISGRLAIGSTTAHPTYSLYNYGQSYLQNQVIVGASFQQLNGASSSFSGKLGIGYTNPAAKLHVKGDIRIEDATDSTTRDHILKVQTDGALSFTDSVSGERMRIDWNGNVGIGTTNPGEKLHVNGNIKFAGSSNKLLSSNGYAHLTFDSIGGFTLGDPNYNYSGTFIKSDQDNYSIELETDGTTMMKAYSTVIDIPRYMRHLGDTNTFFGFPSTDRFLVATAGSTRMFFDSSGNMGLGTTSPSYQLQLSLNSAAKPTSSTWTVVSDKRVKTNIRSYETGLKEILQVNPKVFDYNGKAGFDPNVKDNIGVIAQEIKDVIPETVKKYKAKLNDLDAEDTELYNFDSHALTFALINSVKELNKKIEELQTQIQTLKQNG